MLFIVYLHKAIPYIDIDISAFMEECAMSMNCVLMGRDWVEGIRAFGFREKESWKYLTSYFLKINYICKKALLNLSDKLNIICFYFSFSKRGKNKLVYCLSSAH